MCLLSDPDRMKGKKKKKEEQCINGILPVKQIEPKKRLFVDLVTLAVDSGE